MRWAFRILFVVTGIFLPRFASLAPAAVESMYAGAIFPRIASILAWPAGRVPFPIAEVVIDSLAAGLGAWGLICFVRFSRGRLRPGGPPRVAHQRPAARRLAGRVLLGAGIVLWSFHLAWGLNHARRPLIERLGWPRIPASATALADLVRFLGREVEEARAEAAASGEFCWQPESDSLGGRLLLPRAALGERLSAAFRNVLPPAGAAIHPAAPKSSPLFDAAMTRIGISGFYSPFTGEALVNRAMPDPAQPFTMAHEMAHQRGIAREDEANFLAWMVCRVSGSPAARYSASLAAFRHAWRALAGAAPDTAAALSHSVIGPEAAGDLRAMRIFWHRHEGSTTRVAERTNDIYLRVSGDAAGVSSYGRMIELLLAYRASHPQLAGARK